MLAYIVRRLLLVPPVLLVVSAFIFSMLLLVDPYERVAAFISDPTALREGREEMELLLKKYGLDQPIYVQYYLWLRNLLRGNLGWSETARMPTWEAIATYFPASAELTLWAAVPILVVGIWLGVLSALHHNRFIDHLTRFTSIVGWSFPTFVFGLIMLMIFYGGLGWFPPGRLSSWASLVVNDPTLFRQYTGLYTLDSLLNGRLDIFADALRHLALPVLTLSYLSWALLVRVTRSAMLEALRQEYVQTARAKGLRERVVIHKHAKRNALIPVVTIGGLMIIGLLNGVVVTETIFNYKGLGYWFANAARQLDMPAVLGFTLFNGVLMVIGNLVVDILYAVIDPRIRLE
ncbi:MAG: ABC transporter permease [Candidatus Bipolaricaulaceae bacterium]